MATNSVPKAVKAKHAHGDTPITKEEKVLLQMYRGISRWERNFFFLILQSLAWGSLTPETDNDTWEQISAKTGLPRGRKAVRHG